jgi:plasmid replication initiation protein
VQKIDDKKKDNLVVVKSNEVIAASYKLSLNEQRIILTCISKLDSMEVLTKKDGITIRIEEIHDLLVSARADTGSLYKDLKVAAERLYDRSIVLDGEGSKRRWVYEVKYNKEYGSITLYFSPTIIPYLSELKGNFTKYRLEHISKFRSVYSIRIYELLCQWSFVGEKEIEVDDLKRLLGVEDKYARTSNFLSRVVDVSVKEINQYSNIKLKCGYRKTGRKITHIQLNFNFKRSKTAVPNNSIDEFVRNNPTLTKGKSEWEVKKLMNKGT